MEFQKYNVKEKKEKKSQKNIFMKFALKKRGVFFFCKVFGYKVKIKGIREDL